MSNNPLLPAQVPMEGFFPELTPAPTAPTITPPGFIALYLPADWQYYQDHFATEAASAARLRSSGQLEFAQKLIAAADAMPARSGVQRLLYLRAMAIAYRHREGTPVAARAIAQYQQIIDLSVPADVAALWTMADAMTHYATTPKPDRQRFAALAAKANIQLTMLLLDAGQIDGAQRMMKMLARHDVAIRNDPQLRPQAALARTLVAQTATMMDYLAGQADRLRRGDTTAAMPLYLYARFVKPDPDLLQGVMARRGQSPVGHLELLLQEAQSDAMAGFNAAEALRNAADALPDGVLKHRTLYAAWTYYDAFLKSSATERERVKRTLAGMAKQAVLTDGAHGPPHIKPFETPATQAATRPGAATPSTPSTAPSIPSATAPASQARG